MLHPAGVAVDSAGNVYICDAGNFRIRKVTPSGVISTFAGNGSLLFSGDNVQATSTALFLLGTISCVATDSSGNVYIADTSNNRIRKVDPSGIITTVAGPGLPFFSGDGGPATSAASGRPGGVAVDQAGNIYIADSLNLRVRKVDTRGIITTVAGGASGFSGDGGPAVGAGMSSPEAVAVDNAGNLYIADTSFHRVRKVDASGTISTFAGNGTIGTAGDGGQAANAQLSGISGLAADSAGNVYITERLSERIRKVSTNGIISTVIGGALPANFTGSDLGDGRTPTNSLLSLPMGNIGIDALGVIYLADTGHNRVRKVTGVASASGTPLTGPPTVGAAVNGASFAANQALGPGSLSSLFGTNLATSTVSASTIPLPTSLAGVSVTVGGIATPLYFVSPGQINFQVPWSLQAGTADVVVAVGGVVSASFRANIGLVSPGVFATSTGQAIAINADGSLAAPAGSIPGIATRPARVGDTVIILATGLGLVLPPAVNGAASGEVLRRTIVNSTVLFGGTAGRVDFSGLSPQFVGIYQLNVVVPNVAAGIVPLQIDLGGIRTPATITMAVQ